MSTDASRSALRRLVQRTLRPEQTLQPYLPSAFEAPLEVRDDDPIEREVIREVPARIREASGDAAFPRHTAAAPDPEPPFPERRQRVPATADEAVQGLRVDEPAAARSGEAAGPAGPPRRQEHVIERVVEHVAERVAEHAGGNASTRAIDASAPPARPPVAAPGPVRTTLVPPAARRPETADKDAVAEPRPEPVISISIGRVEVRAVTPPARQQAARPRERRIMSLDDYLDRRARGGPA